MAKTNPGAPLNSAQVNELKVFDFSPLEYCLLLFAILQVGLASYLLISGTSLRNFLFGIDQDLGARKVAVLGKTSGAVKQKRLRSPEFRGVETSAPLYNEDTVLTGPASSAQIILDDGGSIELSSDTMVKLSFSSDYLLGLQVSRTPKIEVVTGSISTIASQSSIIVKSQNKETLSVKGQKSETKSAISKQMPDKVILPQTDVAILRPVAKAGGAQSNLATLNTTSAVVPTAKPSILPVIKNTTLAKNTPASPIPSPKASAAPVVKIAPPPAVKAVSFKISEPIANAKFNPQLDNGVPLARAVFRARVTPLIPKAQVVLRSPQGIERAIPIDFDRNGDGAITLTFNRPGNWTISVRQLADTIDKSKPVQITVNPEVYGLALDDLTIAGETTNSNRYSGKKAGEFSAKFSWSRVEGAKDYSLQIVNAQNKVLYTRKVTNPEHEIKDVTSISSQLGERSISYRVQANLNSGFIANSEARPIRYQFFPPVLTAPAPGAVHSLEKLKEDEGRILFSWQKTNFTDAYQIELSKDENYTALYVSQRLKDNFLILKFDSPGIFYWRVRAYTDGKPGLTSTSAKVVIEE